MKCSILTSLLLTIVGVAFATPVAEPEPGPEPISEAVDTKSLVEKRAGWSCTLVKSAPGIGSVPCYSGANTGYSVVTHYSVNWLVDVYCKAYGGVYEGDSVWDYIDRGGNNCWISAYHTNSGCESPVRWC